MRIPLPDNVTWNDRGRVQFPVPVIWHGKAIEVPDDTPQTTIDAIGAALLAYVPKYRDADAEQARQIDERAAWLARNWADKTPAEIQALVEARIDSITTLAQAKAVLGELLPLMAWAIMALAHQTLER